MNCFLVRCACCTYLDRQGWSRSSHHPRLFHIACWWWQVGSLCHSQWLPLIGSVYPSCNLCSHCPRCQEGHTVPLWECINMYHCSLWVVHVCTVPRVCSCVAYECSWVAAHSRCHLPDRQPSLAPLGHSLGCNCSWLCLERLLSHS